MEERKEETGSREQASRERGIVRTSVVGIATNVLLAAFKAAVGLLSNSIAIVLDAVNNLSDAASSIITIVGTKLAGKAPDHKHPFGYGRIEYLTTIVISVIVLWAGITSLQQSVERIVSPEESSYTIVSLVIVAVAIAVKLLLGRYFKAQGKKLSSDSLVASGTDATMDAVLSASTLLAALITVFAHVSIEAWVGALISVFIIKAGVDILREAIGKILGERIDAETSQAIKHEVTSVPGVRGAYDLILNDYGPERLWGSVHVEVPDDMTAKEIDRLTRTIQRAVMEKCGVLLHTVGVYSSNTANETAAEMRDTIEKVVLAYPEVTQMHGFYLDERSKSVSFDIIIGFDTKERQRLYEQIKTQVEAIYPAYAFNVQLDADVSD